MEDRLKGLRKSMENTTFKHLSFLINIENECVKNQSIVRKGRRYPFSSVATSYE